MKRWLEVAGVETLYIEPGSPWENAYAGRDIHWAFRRKLLKREVFANLLEAKVLVEEYRNHYNHERPHSALDYLPPAEFAASCDLVVPSLGLIWSSGWSPLPAVAYPTFSG